MEEQLKALQHFNMALFIMPISPTPKSILRLTCFAFDWMNLFAGAGTLFHASEILGCPLPGTVAKLPAVLVFQRGNVHLGKAPRVIQNISTQNVGLPGVRVKPYHLPLDIWLKGNGDHLSVGQPEPATASAELSMLVRHQVLITNDRWPKAWRRHQVTCLLLRIELALHGCVPRANQG